MRGETANCSSDESIRSISFSSFCEVSPSEMHARGLLRVLVIVMLIVIAAGDVRHVHVLAVVVKEVKNEVGQRKLKAVILKMTIK